MMIFTWLAIGLLVYYLVDSKGAIALPSSHNRSPDEILMERFVNGEINEITYNQMKETLKK